MARGRVGSVIAAQRIVAGDLLWRQNGGLRQMRAQMHET